MTAQEIYLEAQRRGLRLEPAGDKLAVIPAKRCPPDLADLLREHKAELLDLLEANRLEGNALETIAAMVSSDD